MSNVLYLVLVLALSAVGLSILWLRTRASSWSRSSVDEFSDKMRALAPDDTSTDDRRPGGGHKPTKAG